MKKIGLLIGVMGVVLVGITTTRHPFTDRFNPLVEETVSYGQVPRHSQDYKRIAIYDESGKRLPYRLNFNGYDPQQEIVKIKHKGKYVILIEYIDRTAQGMEMKKEGTFDD